MRIRYALLCSGVAALTMTVLAQPAPAADPTPTPSPSASGLPIGSVDVDVTGPNSQPTDATHVEQPPIH